MHTDTECKKADTGVAQFKYSTDDNDWTRSPSPLTSSGKSSERAFSSAPVFYF